jgi:hypothetical protein
VAHEAFVIARYMAVGEDAVALGKILLYQTTDAAGTCVIMLSKSAVRVARSECAFRYATLMTWRSRGQKVIVTSRWSRRCQDSGVAVFKLLAQPIDRQHPRHQDHSLARLRHLHPSFQDPSETKEIKLTPSPHQPCSIRILHINTGAQKGSCLPIAFPFSS